MAAWRLRIPIHSASVIEDDGVLGHVRTKPPTEEQLLAYGLADMARLEREIVVCYAGMAAEHELTGAWDLDGARNNIAIAGRIALSISGSAEEIEALLHLMDLRAQTLVRNPLNWAIIQAVAARLETEEKMTGKALRQTIREAVAAIARGLDANR